MTPRRAVLAILVVLAVAGAAAGQTPAPAARTLILSTTTSTQDSGLLDVLIPMFEQATGYSVKTISVGTGQALALAARGEADVTLAHAPALEKKYVEDGKMLNRRLVMYNDFVVVGPAEDPAQIRGRKAADALARIAQAQARFVSRGDKSGTHLLEQALWKSAGVEPRGAWYIESGQGMGQTLRASATAATRSLDFSGARGLSPVHSSLRAEGQEAIPKACNNRRVHLRTDARRAALSEGPHRKHALGESADSRERKRARRRLGAGTHQARTREPRARRHARSRHSRGRRGDRANVRA